MRKIFQLSDHVQHPGKLLREQYLPAIGIAKDQVNVLTMLLQMDRAKVGKLLNRKGSIDLEMANQLARVFNTSPLFWNLLQRLYDEAQGIDSSGSDSEGTPASVESSDRVAVQSTPRIRSRV